MNKAPDTILRGGKVFTADPTAPWAEAIAIADGAIEAVGAGVEIERLAGSGTEVIDLDGRLVLPGFQDAHLHAVGGGLDLIGCDLTGVEPASERRRMIAEYANQNPDLAWVRSWGLDLEGADASVLDLDGVGGGRPVVVFDESGFRALVNQAAMDAAGLGAGAPSGEVVERERLDAVRELIPPLSEDELRRGLLAAESHLLRLGVTAWHDAGLGAWKMGDDIYEIGQDTYDVHVSCAERGDLTARVVGAMWWDRHGDRSQVEKFKARRGSFGRFRCETVKIQQDGICEQRTAAMLEPYLGPDGGTGQSFNDPELLDSLVTELDGMDFQIHMHGIGDRGIRQCLDALTAARDANGLRDLRHHIAHVQVPHPDDLPRFAELAVTANMQPLWAMRSREMVGQAIPLLGPERGSGQYPMGSLNRLGARLAFGTDWAWTSADPIWGIHVAVNRTAPPGFEDVEESDRDVVLDPEERIDLATAVTAYTRGSAFVNHLDAETGTVEVGKRADLVVLDRDLFAGPAEEIGSAKVDLTLVDGAAVYDSSSSSEKSKPGGLPNG